MAKRSARAAGLDEYRRKRHFERTPEPPPERASSETGRSFVVQQHAARRMHYDFRLELDGVLLSWAVPKGPSVDPKDRRLAVRTEDHPVEYGTFEGIIPKGEYGGGTVLLWDRGTWTPIGDPREGLEKGHLRFTLEGAKLRGRYSLVQTRGTSDWLLIKGKDDDARPGHGDALLRKATKSVSSGRTMEEIASAPDRVWHSGEESGLPDPASVARARRASMPELLAPELATLVDAPPEGDEWIHEIKLDGYRILSRIEDGGARLFTRKGNDWTARLPSLARALRELPVRACWLDGEIVVLDGNGKSDFGALQQTLGTSDEPVRYFVFDLLYLDGFDLSRAPLLARKELLHALLARTGALEGRLRFSDHVVGSGEPFFEQACALGLEGIVSKHGGRAYVPRRTKDWRKVKCTGREEAIVVGFSEPSGSRSGLGALLLGQREDGALRFIGKVGTGFDARTLTALRARLGRLETPRPKDLAGAPRGAAVRGVHWVRPEVVVEVRYTERTSDGKLRHPVFVGVREDKPAREVTPERPARAKKGSATIAGVKLSSPDKVLFPGLGVTKRELAEYYEAIADVIVPHVKDRPLTLVRCPEGVGGSCFYAQHAFEGMPRAIRAIRVKSSSDPEPHTAVRDVAGLVSLAQIGVLEVHTWCSRTSRLEKPDQLVFDLDPGPGVSWAGVVEGALTVRALLDELGLASFVKTTGGKGLHVVVPIHPEHEWDRTKAFTHAVAKELARRDPKHYTATIAKAKRKGKIFVDYLRNARGATAICAYSTRAREGAPVSTPLTWEELAREPAPDELDLRTVRERVRTMRAGPWSGFFTIEQSITPEMERDLGA